MKFRILGPLEVHDGGRQLALGAAKRRSLLGALLLHANEAVSSDRLVDELWGSRPPARAAKLVQGHVSALRKLLDADRIVTQPPGYLIRVQDSELDLFEFERAVAQARADETGAAAELLRDALAVWRGPALSDLRLEGFAAREVERLNELRLATLLERIDADLALGRHAGLLGELETLIAQHPLQERPRGQLMLALYRSGRQAEALALYRATRTILADELGLEPGQELQRLERQMLTHDPELDLPRAATPVARPTPATEPAARAPARVRRLISVVFADLVGSTTLAERLDPESLHSVLARYSDACATVLERHGGAVETFLGDAVVAVFGLPELHEDDALRAVRAAVELRHATGELRGELERAWGVGIDVKISVNSGEVFVGAGSRREAFASGDTLNVAARLEEAAEAGEILLGEPTYRLVEQSVHAEPLEPLAVEGREAAVRAWRLLELFPEEAPPLRPAATPFVGRERELAELEQALERAERERACRLCTVLGPPGIGKSRLTAELIERVGGGARFVVGRCVSYGEGLTYLPLAEIVHRLGDDPPARIDELLAGEERRKQIAGLLLGAAGLTQTQGQTEEIAWAFRRLLEALARDRPLVAVLEDVHWAEPTLLDLVDYVAGFSTGAPILLLCLARPELVERRPTWAAPQPNRTLLALDPLPELDAHALVDHLDAVELDERARARVVQTAEGNPLFLEQLVAVQAEADTTAMPPSVQAVLAARIGRLEPGERTVLERASVEGRSFHRGALAELLPEAERDELATRLTALLAKQLIRPDRPELTGEDAFRFAHVLIREAAYEGVPKQLRSELHERLAAWLEPKGAGDELVGYHLEQAHRFRADLAPLDEQGRELGRRAAERLLAAGRAAASRGDEPASVNLLERGGALLPVDDPERLQAQPELATALIATGEFARADLVLREAIELARTTRNERLEARGQLARATIRNRIDPAFEFDSFRAEAERLIDVFERLGDDDGLASAWLELGAARFGLGRCEEATEAYARALDFAGRAPNRGQTQHILVFLGWAIFSGPLPTAEGIRRLDELRRHPAGEGPAEAAALACGAVLKAMRGQFEDARREMASGLAILHELGRRVHWAGHTALSGRIELLAGDPVAAERELRAGYDVLEGLGETAFLSTAAAELGEAVWCQGRLEEALRLTDVSERTAAQDDVASQSSWRSVRARVLAEQGDAAGAEQLARQSVALLRSTDYLIRRGDSLVALADVLRVAERPTDAATVLEEALHLYERKDDIVSAAKTRTLLDPPPAPRSRR